MFRLSAWNSKLLFVTSYLSLRTSPQTGVAIPRLEGECINILPTEWKISHFWRKSLPGSIQRGDCHDQSADWSRNDSKDVQTPICRSDLSGEYAHAVSRRNGNPAWFAWKRISPERSRGLRSGLYMAFLFRSLSILTDRVSDPFSGDLYSFQSRLLPWASFFARKRAWSAWVSSSWMDSSPFWEMTMPQEQLRPDSAESS